jgi:hypothetical protein
VCGQQRQAVGVHPVRPDQQQLEAQPDKVKDLSVSNADANSAYFDDKYLIDNFDEIDAAWQAWKGAADHWGGSIPHRRSCLTRPSQARPTGAGA